MEFQLSYFKSEKRMLLKCCTQYVSKFQKLSSGHRTGVCFHSNLKEGQCQRMFKLPYNCTHFTCQQGNDQNPSSQASAVHELRTRCTSWIQKRQRNQRSSYQHSLDHRKKQENSRKTSTSSSLTMLKSLTVWIATNNGKFIKRQEYQTTLPAS